MNVLDIDAILSTFGIYLTDLFETDSLKFQAVEMQWLMRDSETHKYKCETRSN